MSSVKKDSAIKQDPTVTMSGKDQAVADTTDQAKTDGAALKAERSESLASNMGASKAKGSATNPASPTNKSNNHGLFWVFLVLILALAGVGGWQWWQKQQADHAAAAETIATDEAGPATAAPPSPGAPAPTAGQDPDLLTNSDRTNRFLKQRITELEKRLAENEKESGMGASPKPNDTDTAVATHLEKKFGGLFPPPLAPQVDNLRAAMDGLQKRLDAIEASLALSQHWQRSQAAYLLLGQIRGQLLTGQPFRSQASNLTLLAAELNGAAESLQTLQSLSVQGVASSNQLQHLFAEAVRQAWAVQEGAGQEGVQEGAVWWRWTRQQLRHLVTVRPSLSNAEPGSVAAVLAEAEAALAKGDLLATHAAMQHLPDRSLAAMDTVVGALNARLKAEQAVQDLEQRVGASMAQAAQH
jgi:hypothetical protein